MLTLLYAPRTFTCKLSPAAPVKNAGSGSRSGVGLESLLFCQGMPMLLVQGHILNRKDPHVNSVSPFMPMTITVTVSEKPTPVKGLSQ